MPYVDPAPVRHRVERTACVGETGWLNYAVLSRRPEPQWAHRLRVEQPTTTSKQGKTTVRYPRGAEAAEQLHA